MLGYPKRPTPPLWKIILYCVLAVLLLAGLGWYNTHVLGDKTHYPDLKEPPSASAQASGAPVQAENAAQK